MVANAIFGCTVEIFEDMDGCLVVLMVGSKAVGGQECESWRHVGPRALCEPVDGAHNPAGADVCASVFFEDFDRLFQCTVRKDIGKFRATL